MGGRIVINGQEVTNPLTRALLVGLGLVVVVGVVGLVIALVLGLSLWMALIGLGAGVVGLIAGLVNAIRSRVASGRGSRALEGEHTRDSRGEPLTPDEWRRGG